jgi:hypothetical protein
MARAQPTLRIPRPDVLPLRLRGLLWGDASTGGSEEISTPQRSPEGPAGDDELRYRARVAVAHSCVLRRRRGS